MRVSLGSWTSIGLAAAVLSGCAVVGDDAATSSEDVTGDKPRVLALGDSMAFAWDPLLEKDPKRVEASRYHGYADMVAAALGAGLDNASCPGETASHFLSVSGEDNDCAKNRATYRLHTDWGNARTQLEFTVRYLQESIARGRPPALVTMSIGGNDLLRIQANCDLPGILGAGCKLVRLPFREHTYGENLETIMRAIDATGYRGKMVFLTTYAPDYSDPIASLGINRFNGEIRESVGHMKGKLSGLEVVVADGFSAFKVFADQHGGKTCETGLLIPNGDGTCDIHPTKRGHEVLAKAILDAVR